jgi:bifunctional NMN adenylyltransferase/nudix hydrolase
MMKYDLLFFIGRFQPFHNGHQKVIQDALTHLAPNGKLLVLVGSANSAPTIRNPFSYETRELLIRHAFPTESQLEILPLPDFGYNETAWINSVNGLVLSKSAELGSQKIAMVGMSKDASSYYLKMFPAYDNIKIRPFVDGDAIVSSTAIRTEMFEFCETHSSNDHEDIDAFAERMRAVIQPRGLKTALNILYTNKNLLIDYGMIKKYKAQWSVAPYPVTFNTVDAVVTQSGHILLVRRGASPGKGQMALPGGFINQSETLQDAMLRELYEETGLKVPKPVLRGSIKQSKTYDDPYRSSRGRTITHAFHIELSPDHSLPKVKGGDDAEKAFWYPIVALREQDLFEDHYHIILDLLKLS